MTIAKSASPLYVPRVFRPEAWARLHASFPLEPRADWRKSVRPTTGQTLVEWIAPFLTVIGAVTWFVITDGLFQLCAVWSF
jgi:hypothetical protein